MFHFNCCHLGRAGKVGKQLLYTFLMCEIGGETSSSVSFSWSLWRPTVMPLITIEGPLLSHLVWTSFPALINSIWNAFYLSNVYHQSVTFSGRLLTESLQSRLKYQISRQVSTKLVKAYWCITWFCKRLASRSWIRFAGQCLSVWTLLFLPVCVGSQRFSHCDSKWPLDVRERVHEV